jgi:hypothetical protein
MNIDQYDRIRKLANVRIACTLECDRPALAGSRDIPSARLIAAASLWPITSSALASFGLAPHATEPANGWSAAHVPCDKYVLRPKSNE